MRSKIRRPLVPSVMAILFLLSTGAIAQGTSLSEIPPPHWSGLPIWGDEAAKRGYQVPLPFGIGATVYSARQPVNITDLKLATRGSPPVSVVDFLVLDTVDTAQQNLSAKFDALIFPFLDVYVLAGYTTGKTNGSLRLSR